ncbi:hypothetical protein N7451_011593 [Penicillium sp. IBT 35674x]|nr:hypothetical protein N7451_011593 [Penicillium sp. IBT 35674x]
MDVSEYYYHKEEYKPWPKQDPPITDIEKVPESLKWNADDNDLEDDDIEGHIARCKERIDTGIMPAIWEDKLKLYRAQHKEKAQFREEVQALTPGRPFEVAQRVFYLYKILASLVDNGDEVEQIPNAEAIISAYKAGDLEWFNDGRVTYWHKGVQICEPKVWDADDFAEVSKIAEGKGFWVEGCYGPGPQIMAPALVVPAILHHEYVHHYVCFEVKVPGALRGAKLQFYDDTGSCVPTLFQSDVKSLRALSPNMAPVRPTGPIVSSGIGGNAITQGYSLDYRVIGRNDIALTPWYRLQTSVHPDSDKKMFGYRLSGSWWRNLLFCANAPDDSYNLYVATNKGLLANNLPEVDLSKVRPEAFAVGYPSDYRGPYLGHSPALASPPLSSAGGPPFPPAPLGGEGEEGVQEEQDGELDEELDEELDPDGC